MKITERVRELLPLFAGMAAGIGWLIGHGGAFSLRGSMWGYGWPEYIQESWLAAHGDFRKIDDLRTAVYSGLLGHLGEAIGSYANAGVLISSFAAVAVILAAGIGAWALSTSWAGGVAAFAAGIALAWQEVPTTINQYPMLAGVSGMALALGIVSARWPRVRWVALAGLLCGLAWAVESRGLVVFPPVILLVALGIWRARSNGWRRLALVFIATLAVGLGLREVLVEKQRQDWEHGAEYREELVDRQRRVVHRWIGSSPQLSQTVCGQLAQSDLLRSEFLMGPCPRFLREDNLSRQLPQHLALGLGLTVLSTFLILLPGRRGRPASLDSAVLIGSAGLGLLFVASLTPMPRRYLFQWAALVAIVGAAGPARLAETLGRDRKWVQPALALGMVAWMLGGGIKGQISGEVAPLGHHYSRYVAAHRLVEDNLAEGDGLMDCSENYVELSLLPRRTQPDYPTKDPHSEYCQSWLESPVSESGQSWILVSTEVKTRPAQARKGSMEGVDLRAALAASNTWEPVHLGDGWELWRHTH